jgi:4-alpha-glucanotransferase
LALATGTTHDVPTLAGWFAGRDLATRERIGLIAPDEAARARAIRRVDASHLIEAFARRGELDPPAFEAMHRMLDAAPDDALAYEPLVRAAYRFLATSPAKIVLVQLDDATREFEQVNVPGTFAEYPNWRRKSGLDLAGIASDTRIAVLASDVHERVRRGASNT